MKAMQVTGIVRAAIIFVCVMAIIPGLVLRFPNGKYYDEEMKAMVKDGRAEVVEYKIKGELDGSSFIVQRLIYTDDLVYIRYSTNVANVFYGFPDDKLRFFDNRGIEYKKSNDVNKSSLGLRGHEGLIAFKKPKDSIAIEYLMLVYEAFDRRMEIKLPVGEVTLYD
ncbi:hypothetical protein [Alkaliphilus transvaalensis]|uniref:hypothetical protein n=1 Tax=Alkaliphilus transvaalensis TaxID=114628 RepID=UPI00047E09F4|nr:hypothetical protein [Alkaliphilus transvaalensis]